MKTAAAFVVLAVCALSAGAQCPEGTHEIDRKPVGNVIRVYCGTDIQEQQLREVDAELRHVAETLQSDRRAIERWNKDLPGYLAAFDEWLALDAAAQKEMTARGVDLGATLLLARLKNASTGAAALDDGDVAALRQAVRASPLGSEEMTVLMRGKEPSTLKTVADLWEFLDSARSAAAAADDARRQQYLRAIVEIGGLALRDPKLKILVSESDFTIAALYANAADGVARRNVEQLLDLGSDRLHALSALSATYARGIRKQNELRLRRAAILEGSS